MPTLEPNSGAGPQLVSWPPRSPARCQGHPWGHGRHSSEGHIQGEDLQKPPERPCALFISIYSGCPATETFKFRSGRSFASCGGGGEPDLQVAVSAVGHVGS